MNMYRQCSLIAAFMGTLILLYPRVVAQGNSCSWSSMSMGFATTLRSNVTVASSIGQSFIGTTSNGRTRAELGFLVDTLFRGSIVSVDAVDNIPPIFALYQNYPNPFNPVTTIEYQLPSIHHVTITVFDVLGREVVTLVDEVQDAGYKSVTFNANNLSSSVSAKGGYASGVYLYRLQARPIDSGPGVFVETRKMLLIR